MKANVVGGGIAGVAVGACLARAGYDVTLFERGLELREIGAGIFVKENSLAVLEQLGQLGRIVEKGSRINSSELWSTGANKILVRPGTQYRTYVLPRQELHAALIDAATSAGVTVVTNAEVASATVDGDLHLADGRRYKGDLTIGADGVYSTVRESVGLGVDVRNTGHGSWRALFASCPEDPMDSVIEYWSRNCRILVTPAGPGLTYVCASSRDDDDELSGDGFNKAAWTRIFPEFRPLIARIPDAALTRRKHVRTWVNSWHRGRVAILGDAVHGQPPNLGQGAGLAIANAGSLVRRLSTSVSPEEGFRSWENGERGFTESVQAWSSVYDDVVHAWPVQFETERNAFVRTIGETPETRRRWLAYAQGLSELANAV